MCDSQGLTGHVAWTGCGCWSSSCRRSGSTAGGEQGTAGGAQACPAAAGGDHVLEEEELKRAQLLQAEEKRVLQLKHAQLQEAKLKSVKANLESVTRSIDKIKSSALSLIDCA